MSRLLAYISNDPQRVRCALHPGRALLGEGGNPPLDGWGVGFYQGGEVLLQRRPRPPSGPIDFYEMVKDLRTDALVGHMRRATVGDAKNENTHPFRFRSWLWAHHGTVPRFEDGGGKVREALVAGVPDYLRRNIRGQTDSEHLFHVFLAELSQAGKLDDALIATRAAARALAAAIAQADRVTGGERGTYDVAVTNGRILVVSRRGPPVHYYQLDGVRDCAVCRELPDLSRGPRADHEHLRAVVVVADGAGEVATGALWKELPDSSIATVSHELELAIAPLAELSPAAA